MRHNYEIYLDTLDKNWELWKHNISPDLDKHKEIAMLNENLKLWNKRAFQSEEWDHLSLSICKQSQMYNISKILFGYQIMIAPTYFAFCTNPIDIDNWTLYPSDKKIYEIVVAATERKMKSCWNCGAVQDLKRIHNLDSNVLVDMLALELAMEQDIKHIANVRNRCQNIYIFSDSSDLDKFLISTIIEERKKFPNRGNQHESCEWMIAGLDMITKLEQQRLLLRTSKSTVLGVASIGNLKDTEIRIYQDPTFPVNEILLGRKYSNIDTGYITLPYLYYIRIPDIIDNFKQEILAKDNHILANHDYYTKIIIN